LSAFCELFKLSKSILSVFYIKNRTKFIFPKLTFFDYKIELAFISLKYHQQYNLRKSTNTKNVTSSLEYITFWLLFYLGLQ